MPAAMTAPLPLVVLISGEGSNLQAIIDRAQHAHEYDVRAVISSRADAHGLQRAQQAGIPTHVLTAAEYPDRAQFDAALSACLEQYHPALIVLAGFMRILSDAFVQCYRHRLINIHPSLLPRYPGLHTHRRALAAGDREHGCSVHFVTEALDGGPVIAQARIQVLAGDTEQRLRERVQQQEHRLYPEVLSWFATGRIALQDEEVRLDGSPLGRPIVVN